MSIFRNEAVIVQQNSDVTEGMISSNISRVLIIYTGGTIGMKHQTLSGYLPVKGFISQLLEENPRFHDKSLSTTTNRCHLQSITSNDNTIVINGTLAQVLQLPALISPSSIYGKRIRYSILEYDPLLDSSNMTMADWVKIATDIELNYQLYDAFLVLHGTDTMSYTASALSFMLENLGKTVIITGSQVPLSEVRNDAVDNLLNALTIAGHFVIPEVGLFFDNKLFRGNRTSKVNALDFNAFDSPNIRPLVSVGINIDVAWDEIWKPKKIEKFKSHKVMQPSVASLRIFPGITAATYFFFEISVKAFLSPPICGVVLETYGSGNAPSNRPELLEIIKEACERGVLIVNCSQCKKGLVSDIYETGKALLKIGVVPGSDMTPECALTKLSYVLGKYSNIDMCRSLIRKNLRGELTTPSRKQRFSYLSHITSEGGLLTSLLSILGTTSTPTFESPAMSKIGPEDSGREDDEKPLERLFVPLIFCQLARHGDLNGIKAILTHFDNLINVPDYDGRTPLHISASEGHFAVTELLLLNGANVHYRDRFNHSPLLDAIRFKHEKIVELLLKCGAHLAQEEAHEVCVLLCNASMSGDLEMFNLLLKSGADLNSCFQDNRTPLHLAVAYRQKHIVEAIIHYAKRAMKKPNYMPRIGQLSIDDNLNMNMEDAPTMTRQMTPIPTGKISLAAYDAFGKTAMEYAQQLQELEIIKLLESAIIELE